jgi:hypothetical protein
MALLERLRPLLSHDAKEMHLKITDKSGKGGLKTKNVFIKGFPSVIFCSAGVQIDEQEGTRFLLLSPETNQEKIRKSIEEKIKRDTDKKAYIENLEADEGRRLLKLRIDAIKEEHIDDVKILDQKKINDFFLEGKSILKPRHQRDVGRLLSLVKAFALLNLWYRERDGDVIIANDDDIESAKITWDKLSEGQEYNLPPYIYNLYRDVIVPAFLEKNDYDGVEGYERGLTKQEIIKKHYEVYGRMIEDFRLRQQILPMLETSGLISQDNDLSDKRKVLITPMVIIRKVEEDDDDDDDDVKPHISLFVDLPKD